MDSNGSAFFTREAQTKATNHLTIDPGNAVALILAGGQTEIVATTFDAFPGRAVSVTTTDGRELMIDRYQIAAFELVRGRATREEAEAEENAAWLAALQELREVCAVSKDKAVVAALEALQGAEKAAEAGALDDTQGAGA